MKKTKCILMFLMVFIPIEIYSENIYVDVNGNDYNNGTKATPVKTIQCALNKVSTMTATMNADINVYIRGGTYELLQPIVVGPEHAGKNGYYVNMRAYLDDEVLISGGKDSVYTSWSTYLGSTKKTNIPLKNFRNLYFNGKKIIRARTGGVDKEFYKQKSSYTGEENNYSDDINYKSPFSYVFDGNNTKIQYKRYPEERVDIDSVFSNSFFNTINFPASGGTNTGVEFVFYDPPRWRMFRWYPQDINTVNREFYFSDRTNPGFHNLPFEHWMGTTMEPGDYPKHVSWVENSLAFLDCPGEWYCDQATPTKLYYRPYSGQVLNTAHITIPVVNKLITFDNVSNFCINGLHFAYTSFNLNKQWGYACNQGSQVILSSWTTENLPSAIEVANSNNIRLVSNEFYNLGGDAIHIKELCSNVEIVGNNIHDISGSGIVVGQIVDQEDPGRTQYEYYRTSYLVNDVQITENNIRRIGNEFFNSVGIFSGFSENTKITNNTISEVPYTGIYIGWGWNEYSVNLARNIDVSYNKIDDMTNRLRDGGAVYLTGFQGFNSTEGTKIHDNYIHNTQTFGVYLDHYANYCTVSSNVIYEGWGYWVYLQEKLALRPKYNVISNNHVWADNRQAGSTIHSSNTFSNTYSEGEGIRTSANTVFYNNITGDLDLTPFDQRIPSIIVNEFSQKPNDFNGVDLNLSVFQTLLVPDL